MNLVTLLKEQVVLAQELRVGLLVVQAYLINLQEIDYLANKDHLKTKNKLLLRELVIS